MSLTPYLLKRFLRFDKDQPFIFLSALLAFLGITIGVMVLIIAMALMNGFDKEFKKSLSVMNYPLTILPRFYGAVNENLLLSLEQKFPQLHFSPYIMTSVIAKGSDEFEGGYLFGVDFQKELHVNDVLKKSIDGVKDISKFDIVIGHTLSKEFNVYKNDKLTYIFTQMDASGLSSTPKMKRFKIIGIFNSGLSAYDKAYSYTSIVALQKILHIPHNQFDGIHIFSPNPQEDIAKIEKELSSSVRIKGWWQDNANFFAALELEKTSLFIVLMLIIMIASINIISSLLMTVMNRRSEIALLISLGVSSSQIKKVFLYLGVIIGIGGILSGVLLGLSGLWILSSFDIVSLPKDVYPTSTLPLDLSTLDFSLIVIGAFIIVVLSSFYPAKKASEVDVLTVLRNE
ncbi:MAG: ABC transporter permease [Campylobacterota bacterium]|nr:ABC transporter permease [Campylobacterota bacterium]